MPIPDSQRWKYIANMPLNRKDTTTDQTSEGEEEHCHLCHDIGWIVYRVPEGETRWTKGGSEVGPGTEMAYRCPECSKQYLMNGTGIPFKYREDGYGRAFWNAYQNKPMAMKAKNRIDDYVDHFNLWRYGLYIYSERRGSGKTMLACSIANTLKARDNELILKFISAPAYMKKLKSAFSEPDVGKRQDIHYKVREYYDCDLLIIDDLGAEKRSDWSDSELFDLIDSRYTNELPTIFTSNKAVRELPEDDRLTDRIYETTIAIAMPEESIRSIHADTAKEEFLRSRGIA